MPDFISKFDLITRPGERLVRARSGDPLIAGPFVRYDFMRIARDTRTVIPRFRVNSFIGSIDHSSFPLGRIGTAFIARLSFFDAGVDVSSSSRALVRLAVPFSFPPFSPLINRGFIALNNPGGRDAPDNERGFFRRSASARYTRPLLAARFSSRRNTSG